MGDIGNVGDIGNMGDIFPCGKVVLVLMKGGPSPKALLLLEDFFEKSELLENPKIII